MVTGDVIPRLLHSPGSAPPADSSQLARYLLPQRSPFPNDRDAKGVRMPGNIPGHVAAWQPGHGNIRWKKGGRGEVKFPRERDPG